MSINQTNLKKVNFDVHVRMSGYSSDHISSEVILSDIPWKIKIFQRKNKNETVVKAALICSPPNVSEDLEWKCEAMATVSLSSSDASLQLNQAIIPKTQFDRKCLSSKEVEVITASDLQPCMRNKCVVFNVRLLANPVFYETPAKIDQLLTKFRFNVNDINQPEKIHISPDIMVARATWNVRVRKQRNNLGIFLRQNSDRNTNWSWKVKCLFSLLSFDKNIQPVTKLLQRNFSIGDCWGPKGFISWTALMDPEKKYVENDRAVFEIHLEVDLPKALWNFEVNLLDGKSLECPVCLQKMKLPAATKCGHLFCNGCIKQSVDQHKKCPNCNAEANSEDIRRIFL